MREAVLCGCCPPVPRSPLVLISSSPLTVMNDVNTIRKRLLLESNEKLRRIAHADPEEYTDAARVAAREILTARGVEISPESDWSYISIHSPAPSPPPHPAWDTVARYCLYFGTMIAIAGMFGLGIGARGGGPSVQVPVSIGIVLLAVGTVVLLAVQRAN